MTSGIARQKVVIIGAGIVGAALAFNLSRRREIDLTVIDQAQPGSGASSHSFAWINAFGKEPRRQFPLRVFLIGGVVH